MSAQASRVLLAKKYEAGTHDPTGWWMSEKLDGVRAYWSGSAFYSRQGNLFPAPNWFKEGLPKYPLDGELFCGRGMFQQTVSIVKNSARGDDWKYVRYLVFDMPMHPGPYEERMAAIRDVVGAKCVVPVGNRKCSGKSDLESELKKVIDAGGEGLMLREPKSRYQNGRSGTLLKVKVMHDAEALVLSHGPGKGRHEGSMGCLNCKLPNGKTFSVGTGFSDAQRRKPPKIGSVITFTYQELSDAGNPRFPAFQRVRGDVTWDDVCKSVADQPTPAPKIKVGLKERQHTLMYTSFEEKKNKDDAVKAGDDAANISNPALVRRNTSISESMTAIAEASSANNNNNNNNNDNNNAAAVRAGQKRARDDNDSGNNGDNNDGDGQEHVVYYDDDGSSGRTAKAKAKARLAYNELYGITTGDDSKDGDYNDDSNAGSAVVDTRPLCKYGAKCYRKNKEHIKRFQHPTRPSGDADNVRETRSHDVGTNDTRDAKRTKVNDDNNDAANDDNDDDGRSATPIMDINDDTGAPSYIAELRSVKSSDDPAPAPIVLAHGDNLIGRGKYGLNSKHLSRRHATFIFDCSAGELRVTPTGLNPVHVKERGSDKFARIAKDESARLFPGDQVSFLPDHSTVFKISMIMAD